MNDKNRQRSRASDTDLNVNEDSQYRATPYLDGAVAGAPFPPSRLSSLLTIGLTGGIGAGKSYVANLLAQQGATVIDTDVISHALTGPSGIAVSAIEHAFGESYVNAQGAMDRAQMRALVFNHAEARRKLEQILHPLIVDEVQKAACQAGGCYLVLVIPLLFESGRWITQKIWREELANQKSSLFRAQLLDRICVVDCDEATQIQRTVQRSALEPEQVERILASQVNRLYRLNHADDTISNDSLTSLQRLKEQVDTLHQYYLRLCKGCVLSE